jgi:hypothetical protein
MSRVLLWLFAAPALTLLILSLFGTPGAVSAVGAALGGQLAAYPIWRRIERHRALEAFRELRRLRRHSGVSVSFSRVQLGLAEMAAQVAFRVLGALVVAATFLATW